MILGDDQAGVIVSENDDPKPHDEPLRPFSEIVHPDDPQLFIRLPSSEHETEIASRMAVLPTDLKALGLTVSTGRVVDFRAAAWLRADPERSAVPLLYPQHLRSGRASWPLPDCRKPNAIVRAPDTESLFVPMGNYVLVKRFTAKEERRHVTATWLRADDLDAEVVGFENHLNYFHKAGSPLDPSAAAGLTCYLNSTLVDDYFRTFSGHTQVNAGDLRSLRYPEADQLVELSKKLEGSSNDATKVDVAMKELGLG